MSQESTTQAMRSATRVLHSRLESTAFAKALLKKTLNKEAYAGFIRVLAVIHATLERQLDACRDSRVRRVWTGQLRRAPQLLQDNDCFRWQLIPDAPAAVEASLNAASYIMLLAEERPLALLGGLYVLGGSTRGAVILAPLVGGALELDEACGLSYLIAHSKQGPGEWEQTAARLNDAVTDPADVALLVAAAQKLFEYLIAAFEALWPLTRATMRYTVTALNPESGNHPVPQNPRVLRAVLRASERCLAEYPYFLYRYGPRGRHYTDADGAWLATLPEKGPTILESQINWLGGLLAVRGMPRLLLARHLEILTEELIYTQPDQASQWVKLQQAAQIIRNKLEARLPETARATALGQFQEQLGRTQDFACAEAMDLLASAVVDEAAGLTGSLSSLLNWLADPQRFSQTWVDAIQAQAKALGQLLMTKEPEP